MNFIVTICFSKKNEKKKRQLLLNKKNHFGQDKKK